MKVDSKSSTEKASMKKAPYKITTVTGETINLSKWAGYSLSYVMECGQDWIGHLLISDGMVKKNNRYARVFLSQNPGAQHLMALAHARGELVITSV